MPAEATIDMPSQMTETAQEIANVHDASKPAWDSGVDAAVKAMEALEQQQATTTPEPRAPSEPVPKEAKPEFKSSVIPKEALQPKAEPVDDGVEKELTEATKNMSEAAGKNFRKLHAKSRVFENRVKELEAQISERQQANGESDDYKKLKADYDALDEEMKKVALERHPKFKAEFDNRRAVQEQLAAKIMDKHPKLLKRFLAGDSDAINDIAEELGPVNVNRLSAIMNNIEAINLERETELKNWKPNYEALEHFEAAERTKAEAMLQRELETAVSKAIAHAQDDHPTYRKVDGNDEWNASVEQRIAQAKKWATGNLTPKERAQIALNAATLPVYREVIAEQDASLRAMAAELKKLRNGKPNIGGSIEPVNTGGKSDELDYATAVTQQLMQSGNLKSGY